MNYKDIVTLIILFFISISTFSQVVYEPGYIINDEGVRKDVLIKNQEWLENPSTFDYKSSESSQAKSAEINNIQEFGIYNGVIYTRATINLDLSSDRPSLFSYQRAPLFEEKILFLKKIMGGKASLYSYNGEGVKRFFFSMDSSNIKPLVYKRYVSKGKVLTNNSYKQYLSNALDCQNLRDEDFSNLKYKESLLKNLFLKYNTCSKSESIIYNVTSQAYEDESKFILTAKGGIRFNAFESKIGNDDLDFGAKIGPQLGLEAEFIFNFNRNKWSGLAQATYFSYKGEATRNFDNLAITEDFEINYSAIEISLGARHSFYIMEKSRLFINVHFILPVNLKQSFNSPLRTEIDEFTNLTNLAFGAGYQYKDIGLEFKYQGARTLINGLTSKYNNYSVVLRYSFL